MLAHRVVAEAEQQQQHERRHEEGGDEEGGDPGAERSPLHHHADEAEQRAGDRELPADFADDELQELQTVEPASAGVTSTSA